MIRWIKPTVNKPDEGQEIIAYKDGIAMSGTFGYIRKGFGRTIYCGNQIMGIEDFTEWIPMKHPKT